LFFVYLELVYCIVEPSAKAKAAGYTLTAQKGRLYVSEITSNSPAYYGGMRKNDEIIEVNEIDVTNKDFDEVKSLLKWDGESTFVIGVRRSKK
jgi:C-terminal processing protease CtpA/Prc